MEPIAPPIRFISSCDLTHPSASVVERNRTTTQSTLLSFSVSFFISLLAAPSILLLLFANYN
jgi:hypothetical protein